MTRDPDNLKGLPYADAFDGRQGLIVFIVAVLGLSIIAACAFHVVLR